jgi:protein O-mannosyl-transferase
MKPLHRLSLLIGLLLCLALVVVFGPVLTHDFVGWDDDLHVYANPHFQPVTWAHVYAFWRAPYEHLYIPLTYTVWAGVVWLTRLWLSPPGEAMTAALFHRLNLLLHLSSTLMVWRIGVCVLTAKGRQETRAAWQVQTAAGAGALLFALHPLQVEAVAWVTGLKDVLCGYLSLMALWQYVVAAQAPAKTTQRRWHYGLATGAFVLALLAKPAAVVLPVVAWVLDVGGLQRPWRVTIRVLGSWLLVAGIWGLWTKGQQPDALMGFVTPLWARPVIAMDTLAFYLGKLLWPVQLGPDYGRTPQLVLAQAWQGGPILAGVGLALYGLRRRQQQLSGIVLALGVFVAGILPVLGFVPFLFQAHSTVADRYVYLAMLGPALGLGWLLQRAGQGRVLWVVVAIGLGVLGWRSGQQVQVWQDTVTLFTHALEVNPRSALAHNNLGLTLAQQGQYDAAIAHYQQALRLRPDFAYTYNNLGLALASQGQLEASIAHYTTALRLQPTYVNAHNNLGLAFISHGQFDDASSHFSQALALVPNDARTHNHLGIALAAQGQQAKTIQQFTYAIRLQPTYAKAYHNLGLALSEQGHISAAIAVLRAALRLEPAWPQAASSLARVLITQRPVSAQTVTEAITLAKQTCRATAYGYATALHTLAVVYQAAGDEKRAYTTARQALEIATAHGNKTLAAQITGQFPHIGQQEEAYALP